MKNENNPFFAGYHDGRPTEWIDVESRLGLVRDFNLDQCWNALIVPGLQKTVEKAVRRRMRKLDPKGEYIPF